MTEMAGRDHAGLMDGVYRTQRHFYDLTRKYYLLGRDKLIERLDVPAGGSVLEIGCGTGRNLAIVARCHPDCTLFGIDISREMLKSAEATMDKAGHRGRVHLAYGDATALDPEGAFGRSGFDRVFLSYALSMIPGWETALEQAVTVLAPGGELHLVDFGQQERLPRWFKTLLHGWLACFHVTPRANLERVLQRIAAERNFSVEFTPLFRDYARHAILRRPA